MGAMLFCMVVAFGTLIVLLADTLITGWPALSGQLLTGLPSTVPAEAGARPAILATLYLGLLVLALLGSDRRADRDLPRGVREPRALVEPH